MSWYEKLPNISLGTVYRNLNALAEFGLIRKIEMPQSSDQFDFTLTHSHLYCINCNKVYDINTTSIEEMKHIIEEENGYTITSCNIVLEGLCKDCQVERKKEFRMDLKGTKTEQNLMTAFAGESQARNKYDYFASRAKRWL